MIYFFRDMLPGRTWEAIVGFISGIVLPIVLQALQARQFRKKIVIAHEYKSGRKVKKKPGVDRITWEIWNCGEHPITPNDFKPSSDITFTFGRDAKVNPTEAKLVINKKISTCTTPTPTPDKKSATLKPIFLNPRNLMRFTFEVRVVDPVTFEVKAVDPGDIEINLPIIGNDPIDINAKRKNLSRQADICFIVAIGLLLAWLVIHFSPQFALPLSNQLLAIMYNIAGVLESLIVFLATLSIICHLYAIVPRRH